MAKTKKRKKVSAFDKAMAVEIDRMNQWCVGRMPWGRALLLAFMAYTLYCSMADKMYQGIFKGLDLGLHEFGHYLFMPLGEFMHVLGGSLFQCLVPLIALLMFRVQKDYFAMSFAMGWLSINLFDVATYADDARSQQLDLVSPGAGPGDEVIHDWNWLLDNLNLLPFDHVIAQTFRLWAVLSMLVCLGLGGWICWQMYSSGTSRGETQ